VVLVLTFWLRKIDAGLDSFGSIESLGAIFAKESSDGKIDSAKSAYYEAKYEKRKEAGENASDGRRDADEVGSDEEN